MRQTFFLELERIMARNKNVYAVTGDLGFPFFDTIKRRFSKRYINVGAAEQAGVDMCVGLALSKKIPVFYSITPFALLRPFETLRTYINHERIPVKIFGSGDNMDYSLDGFSTCIPDLTEIMTPLKNIRLYKPESKTEIPSLLTKVIHNDSPAVVIISRGDRIQKHQGRL